MRLRLTLLASLLREAWPAWVGIGIPLLGWWAVPLFLRGADGILYFGVALEILGVLVVAYELIEVRKQLESPGMVKLLRRWFGRWARTLSPRPIARLQGPARSDSATATARPAGGRTGEQPSTADQLASLLQMVDAIHARLYTVQRLRAIEQRIDDEFQGTVTQIRMLESQLQRLSLGNIGREFVGAAFIVFGILMANLSEQAYAVRAMLVA